MAALTNDRLIFHFLNGPILQGWLAWIKRYGGGGGGRREEEEGGGDGGGGEQSEKVVIIENIHKSSAGMFQASAKCLSQQIDVFSVGGYKSKKNPPPSLSPRPEVMCFIYHEQSHEYFLFSCLFPRPNFLNWTKHRLKDCAGSAAAVGFVSRRMLHEEKKKVWLIPTVERQQSGGTVDKLRAT